MNNLNGNKFEASINEKIPFYSEISAYYDLRKKPREIIQLTFPLKFIRTLFKDAINNYLIYCENELIDPFENNDTNRKAYKAWYD